MKNDTYRMLSKPFEDLLTDTALSSDVIRTSAETYDSMIEAVRGLIVRFVPYNQYLSLLDGIRATVARHLEASLRPGEVHAPSIPLANQEHGKLYKEEIASAISKSTIFENRLLTISAFAGLCYETRKLWSNEHDLYNQYSHPLAVDVVSEITSYGFWKAISQNSSDGIDTFGIRDVVQAYTTEHMARVTETVSQYAKAANRLERISQTANEKIEKVVYDAAERITDMAEKLDNSRDDIDRQEQVLSEIALRANEAQQNIDAFSIAVREELKIDTTKKLWKSRAFWSAWSYWISAIVFAVATFGPTWWVITHIEAVIVFLQRVGNAAAAGLPAEATTAQLTAATISRLVIITAPLGLYLWAIKLIVRFNTRSMVLMDDARQRHTTMDTYFHLIERSAATTEERGLMLNALFRPLPGQGQENVEPPNFMELVRKPD